MPIKHNGLGRKGGEVIDRYLRALREVGTEPGEEVRSITGLIPADLDAEAEYRRFLSQKHSR